MVVDTGEHLAFATIGQIHPADKIELPQVHRRLTLPPTVLAAVLLRLGPHQPVAYQDSVHGAREGGDATPDCPSWKVIRRAPQRGWVRRISHTRASTVASTLVGLVLGRRDASRSASMPPARYLPFQACTVCRDTPYRTATSLMGDPSKTSSTAR
jgi:hypothetical protein